VPWAIQKIRVKISHKVIILNLNKKFNPLFGDPSKKTYSLKD
jgi:hypothetical protein